jgi:hypothetical protein
MFDHIYGSKGQHIGFRRPDGIYDSNDRKVADVDVANRLFDPATGKQIGHLQPVKSKMPAGQSLDHLFTTA